jgi:hypothetical protein
MFNQSTIQQKELPKVMQSSGCILFKTSHEISCQKKSLLQNHEYVESYAVF